MDDPISRPGDDTPGGIEAEADDPPALPVETAQLGRGGTVPQDDFAIVPSSAPVTTNRSSEEMRTAAKRPEGLAMRVCSNPPRRSQSRTVLSCSTMAR